jgi:hypothetical protein
VGQTRRQWAARSSVAHLPVDRQGRIREIYKIGPVFFQVDALEEITTSSMIIVNASDLLDDFDKNPAEALKKFEKGCEILLQGEVDEFTKGFFAFVKFKGTATGAFRPV